ncbi:MAG: nucleotidyltransferase family protein [bacterium]
MRKSLTIVILAGGTEKCWNGTTTDGSNYKAMVSVCDRPMWESVANAIPPCDQLFVIGEWIASDHFLDFGKKCLLMIPGTGSLIGNLQRAIERVRTEQILFVTCDIPALTKESVQDFIDQCSIFPDLGISGVVVSKEKCLEQFPSVPRTFVNFAEGSVTFGNLIMMERSVIERHLAEIRSAYNRRKNPLALASLLGPGLLLRFLWAQLVNPNVLSLEMITERLTAKLNIPVRVFASQYPGVAEDIDSIKHLVPMLRVMKY